jgi:hypothetical protein
MHLVASCMLSAGRCITSGHDAPSACRMLSAEGLWSRSATTVQRKGRRTGLLQQRSAVWPGDAGVPRDGSCAAPLVARAARHAAVVWQTAVA